MQQARGEAPTPTERGTPHPAGNAAEQGQVLRYFLSMTTPRQMYWLVQVPHA